MRNLGTTLTEHSYTACFERYGRKAEDGRLTAVFTQVASEKGQILSDHIWLKQKDISINGESFKKGDIVSFSAEPFRYIKGVHRGVAFKELEADIGLRNARFFALKGQKN